MALRFKFPGGTLKIKTYRELRERERRRSIPVFRLGGVFFCWWRNAA